MHGTHLDDQASPLATFSAPPFRAEEWRNLGLASCARLLRQSEQRHHSTDSGEPSSMMEHPRENHAQARP